MIKLVNLTLINSLYFSRREGFVLNELGHSHMATLVRQAVLRCRTQVGLTLGVLTIDVQLQKKIKKQAAARRKAVRAGKYTSQYGTVVQDTDITVNLFKPKLRSCMP